MTTTAAMRRKRGLRSSEDGAIAVEAALVLPIFVVLLLGIVDFAQAFFIWNTLQLVVGQASRYVMVQTSIPPRARHQPTARPLVRPPAAP
jgi:Flp pilus assembly protein TadG